MSRIIDLKNRRKELWEQAKAFLEANRDSNGLVPETQVKVYEGMVSDILRYDDEIKRVVMQEKLERQINGVDASDNAVELSKTGSSAPDNDITPLATDAYNNAFSEMLRGNGKMLEVQNVLSVGQNEEGGYTVSDEFEKKLLRGLNDRNVIRNMATVITTKSGLQKIPVLSGLPEAEWIDENKPIPNTDMKFERVLLGSYKMGAMLQATNEFLLDTAFNMEKYIADSFSLAFGTKEENAFINGTGIKQPTGLLHDTDGAGIGAVTDKPGIVTLDDVIHLYYSLGAPYREKAVFLCNEDLLMQLMLLKDGNGNYIWKPSMEAGKPDTILGKPIVTSSAMPELKAGNKVLLFGDFSYYWIADRGKRSLSRLNELFAAQDKVGFWMTQRLDGRLVLKEAVKALRMQS